MPRRKSRDQKGDNASHETRAAQAALRSAPRPVLGSPAPSFIHPTPNESAMASLESRTAQGDGRYSVNCADGQTWYHKWRWSAGPLAGRYVMYVQGRWEPLAEGVHGLLRKVDAAERGEEYATLDKYR